MSVRSYSRFRSKLALDEEVVTSKYGGITTLGVELIYLTYLTIIMIEAVMAQWHKCVTLNATVVTSVPIEGINYLML